MKPDSTHRQRRTVGCDLRQLAIDRSRTESDEYQYVDVCTADAVFVLEYSSSGSHRALYADSRSLLSGDAVIKVRGPRRFIADIRR